VSIISRIIGRSRPSCWQGPSLLLQDRGNAQSAEAQRAKSGWGRAVSSLSGVWGRVFLKVFCILEAPATEPLLELLGGDGKFGGEMAPLCPSLNLPMFKTLLV